MTRMPRKVGCTGSAKRALVGALALTLAAAGLSACVGANVPSAVVAFDEPSTIRAVNAFRAENGLGPVTSNPLLEGAAERQSEAMASAQNMSHSVAGRLPTRVQQMGYNWSATAENIGRGYTSHGAALAGWINSPGHRRNLLNPRVTEIGLAAAKAKTGGQLFWTMILAAPR